MDFYRAVSRQVVDIKDTDVDIVQADIVECLKMIGLEVSCFTGKTIGQAVASDNARINVDVRTKINEYGMWINTTVTLNDVEGDEE